MPDPQTPRKPSTTTWLMIHIGFPMLPFLLEATIRFLATEYTFSFKTFNSSTLAISIGLLCVFVNQSLLTHQRALNDAEEQETIAGTATLFISFAITSFAFFGIIVLLHTLTEAGRGGDLTAVARAFERVVFVGWVIPFVVAIRAQRSFKLRATA